jgi:hypothetical protein
VTSPETRLPPVRDRCHNRRLHVKKRNEKDDGFSVLKKEKDPVRDRERPKREKR